MHNDSSEREQELIAEYKTLVSSLTDTIGEVGEKVGKVKDGSLERLEKISTNPYGEKDIKAHKYQASAGWAIFTAMAIALLVMMAAALGGVTIPVAAWAGVGATCLASLVFAAKHEGMHTSAVKDRKSKLGLDKFEDLQELCEKVVEHMKEANDKVSNRIMAHLVTGGKDVSELAVDQAKFQVTVDIMNDAKKLAAKMADNVNSVRPQEISNLISRSAASGLGQEALNRMTETLKLAKMSREKETLEKFTAKPADQRGGEGAEILKNTLKNSIQKGAFPNVNLDLNALTINAEAAADMPDQANTVANKIYLGGNGKFGIKDQDNVYHIFKYDDNGKLNHVARLSADAHAFLPNEHGMRQDNINLTDGQQAQFHTQIHGRDCNMNATNAANWDGDRRANLFHKLLDNFNDAATTPQIQDLAVVNEQNKSTEANSPSQLNSVNSVLGTIFSDERISNAKQNALQDLTVELTKQITAAAQRMPSSFDAKTGVRNMQQELQGAFAQRGK